MVITTRPGRLMRRQVEGVAMGKEADLVVPACPDPEGAVAEVAAPRSGFKLGRRPFPREPAVRHRPR